MVPYPLPTRPRCHDQASFGPAPSHAAPPRAAWRVNCGAGRRGALPAARSPNPSALTKNDHRNGDFHE